MFGAIKALLGLGKAGLDVYLQKANGNVQKAVALMEADKVRLLAQRDVTIAAMGNWIWWTGWALFVLPLGVYFAKVILWDTTLGLGTTPPLRGFVLEWSGWIVLSMFGMQVANSIINRVWK